MRLFVLGGASRARTTALNADRSMRSCSGRLASACCSRKGTTRMEPSRIHVPFQELSLLHGTDDQHPDPADRPACLRVSLNRGADLAGDAEARRAVSAPARPSHRYVTHGNVRRVLILALLLLYVSLPALANGEASTVTISDLGQASEPVEVGQAPLAVQSSGACPRPFTLKPEASCPSGTWPALGGDWSPFENVAGGDRLRLAFSIPVSDVTVASTSDWPPGEHTPSGEPMHNFDVLPPTAAKTAPEPGAWIIRLPPLSLQAIGGFTFSVVATDAGSNYDYHLSIKTPRYANEATQCGVRYYSTGVSDAICDRYSEQPGTPPRHRGLHIVAATLRGSNLRLNVRTPSAGTVIVGIPTRVAATSWLSVVRHVNHAKSVMITAKVHRLRMHSRNSALLRLEFLAHDWHSSRLQPVRLPMPRR
jgi:hypothetical protein